MGERDFNLDIQNEMLIVAGVFEEEKEDSVCAAPTERKVPVI